MPIYAWGSNGSAQLGIGHQDDVSEPTEHDETLCVSKDEIQALTAGGNHTLILFRSGRLAVIGNCPGNSQALSMSNVKLCSATWDASFVYTESHKLLAFGSGERGELGLDTIMKHTPEPTLLDLSSVVPADVEILQLASGVQHTVAVLSNGEVLGWGNGRKGQLGEPGDVVWKPRKISGLSFKVKRASCGQNFTFVVGDPEDGQCAVLGLDKFGIRSNAPSSVVDWKDIGASWGSLFVLFKSGQLVSWGRNDHGQLAPSDLTDIDQIAVGSEHALALSKDNKLFAWGWGEHGNCGPDIDEAGDSKEARQMHMPEEDSKITGIAAGCATSWAWT